MKIMKTERAEKSVNGSNKGNNNLPNFYESLPRFVDDQPIESVGANLPKVERLIRYGEKTLTLTISAAQVIRQTKDADGSQLLNRLPGDPERQLEMVLRELAVTGNINFNSEKKILCTTLRQLDEKINRVYEESQVSEDEIRLALVTLLNVNYMLKNGGREFNFHPIEALRQVEHEGETIYQILLTPVFFDDGLFGQYLLGLPS